MIFSEQGRTNTRKQTHTREHLHKQTHTHKIHKNKDLNLSQGFFRKKISFCGAGMYTIEVKK